MARVAVVDDSRLMRHLVGRVLQASGHEALYWEEANPEDILGRIQEQDPDLLITDYLMPDCDGLTVAKLARGAKPDLPVVLLTAVHDPALSQAQSRGEVDRIIHKPLHDQDLREALRALL